jgi:hypothetical protein
MEAKQRTADRILWGLSLIIAPTISAASTFWWANGEQGIVGGTLGVVSAVFWVPAFIGLFDLLKPRMPYYATVGLLIAIYGSIGGSLFGFRDVYAAAFNIAHATELQTFAQHALAFNLTLFWPGPLFPLSVLVLGINLIRGRAVQSWVGALLCLGAIVFPVSRIPRIEIIAHIADFLLLLPLAYIGWTLLAPKGLVGGQPR